MSRPMAVVCLLHCRVKGAMLDWTKLILDDLKKLWDKLSLEHLGDPLIEPQKWFDFISANAWRWTCVVHGVFFHASRADSSVISDVQHSGKFTCSACCSNGVVPVRLFDTSKALAQHCRV
jgi:hypothetical protein